MKIIIYRNREVYKENSKIGNDSENKVETLDFEFPEEFKEFNKYIEFQIKGEKCVDLIQNNQYVITRSIAKYGKIKTQIVLKKIVDNDTIVFKSNIFTVNVSASINASEEIEQTLNVDIIQTLSQNISKIENDISNLEREKANKEEIPIVPNWAKQDNKPQYTADEITFEDGETFQEKYNIGELNGINGKDGVDGKSAYEIALEKGFQGTVEEWLTSLKGQDGIDGKNGADGLDGKDGTNGIDGINGKSAYQIWLDNGNTGTEEEFLISLKGQDGVYDDTEVKQDILEMQEEQTQQNTKITALETDNTTNKQDILNIQEEQTVQNTKIEENSVEIATLKAEKERLQQENEDLRNAAPSGQASGENLTLEDSADIRLKKLKISGNSWQETRSGKNLYTTNANVDKDNDGWITINIDNTEGTSAIYKNFYGILESKIKESTKYSVVTEIKSISYSGNATLQILTVNADNPAQLSGWAQYDASALNTKDIKKYEITSASNFENCTISTRSFIGVPAGASINITFRISIIEGTVATDTFEYEKYGAMPNMEFQSQIRACGDNVNLLQNTLTSRTINGLDFDVKEDKTIVVNGTATKDSVIELATFNRKRKIYAIGNAEDSK